MAEGKPESCAFCAKPRRQTRLAFRRTDQGSFEGAICAECIGLCVAILDEEFHGQLPDEVRSWPEAAEELSVCRPTSPTSSSLAQASPSTSTVADVGICAACHKTVRPFPVPRGMLATNVSDLLSGGHGLPRIEADHAFRCERCGRTICPVCSGKKASSLRVRAFVCTECGHQPLETIYRV